MLMSIIRIFCMILCALIISVSGKMEAEARSGEIKTDKVNVVFSNKYLELQNNDVTFQNGKKGTYLKFTAPGGKPSTGVVILVINDKDEVLLVRSFRYAVGVTMWELPRGGAEGAEDYISAGLRELREETSIERSHILSKELMGVINPNSAISDSEVALVSMRVKDTQARPDQEEVQEAKWVHLDQLMAQVQSGEIKDAFTISALFFYVAKRLSLRLKK